VDEAAVTRWLTDYIAAWKSYDAAMIGELFSEDAEYRWHPWDESDDVARGREAIVTSWLDDQDAPGSWEAEYRPWAVDGNRAVAVGLSRYLATDDAPETAYHNVFLLRFDDDGRCAEFTDVYMRRPD
jgi:ketosteroid isomerase-like protein